MRCGCAAVILSLGLALSAGASSATTSGGLRGLVTRGPITPVCIQGIPCSAPAKNTRLVFFRTQKTVRARMDERGHYRVVLAPGWWTVRLAVAPRIGRGVSPSRVRVLAGRFRIVDFAIDTGIR